jgi:hypothetical protein
MRAGVERAAEAIGGHAGHLLRHRQVYMLAAIPTTASGAPRPSTFSGSATPSS